MNHKELANMYIASAEHVLRELKFVSALPRPKKKTIMAVFDSARAYLEDAKYYRDKQKLDVSLVSVAYCEGLLDALRMLGAVEFEWPQTQRQK